MKSCCQPLTCTFSHQKHCVIHNEMLCHTLLNDRPQIITGIQAYLNIWQLTLLCTNTFLYFSEIWPWNTLILTYLPRLYLVTLQCERSLFGVPCNPFPFDNASFSIIPHLIYCLQGEKLIPTGYAAYCSQFLGFFKWFFLDFIMTDWKGSTREQVARHVMVVIAVCTLIDVRKNS